MAAAGADPLDHFLNHGLPESRDPNPFFDCAWYVRRYADVAEAQIHPLLHYMQHGAVELRDPHRRFDAAFYAEEHPEAAFNPLLHHLAVGAALGYPTEKRVAIEDCLPAAAAAPVCPPGIAVDVIIPVYRGLDQTRRCLESVLADPERPPGQVIVIDDHAPEPGLSDWLDRVNATGRIRLIRHTRNRGFVISTNRGMEAAGRADVVLLNSDTEVPRGWLGRLAGHAYAAPGVGTVSPLSNRATICSYPGEAGGPMPDGLTVAEMDALCLAANAGRGVTVPTTVGFCMYIRRACLDQVGLFDAKAFGRGYGEENDFCMRARAAGWAHRLACDTFVYHEGSVSFGVGSADARGKIDVLLARHPTFTDEVARHIRRDQVGPFRFAITAALYRRSGLPVILLVSHGLGGGVAQHMETLAARASGRARFLLLTGTTRGVELSVPGRADHPVLPFAADRVADIAALLRAAGVSRVHVHHVLGLDLDLRRVIDALGTGFDFTVHDYFAICPQINLLPRRDGPFCGEPGQAVCNACMAARPEHGATDILTWRARHAWLLREAERVICPSEDARSRIARYGAAQTVVAPHEPVAAGAWPVKLPSVPPSGRINQLRIAVLGVLTSHKGSRSVVALAELSDPGAIGIHLIGWSEIDLPPLAAARIVETGKYRAPELPRLIAAARPHVIWFPGQGPETYSYTLTAAIASGMPIVATAIGAFPERLAGRPHTWLVAPDADLDTWRGCFETVRRTLASRVRPPASPRPASPDFYTASYLNPPAPALIGAGPIDLRRPGRTSVVVVPDRLANGTPSPCAYVRLLQPADHLAASGDLDVTIAESAEDALRYRADVLATQRHAVTEPEAVARIGAHCRAQGMHLLYDLDDDLIDIPPEHPEFARLVPLCRSVAAMAQQADTLWVSTAGLAERLARLRPATRIVPNALDERLWPGATGAPGRMPFGPVRILFMGTATHDEDLALVLPALTRLAGEYGAQVSIEVIGVTAQDLPAGLGRVLPPAQAAASYPGFVSWITQQPAWDFGIAPLVDKPFSRAKSAIKAMDYAALGLAMLASDMAVYRGSIADGVGGLLVRETPGDWFAALSRLVADWRLRERLKQGAREAFAAHTLAAQAGERRAAWAELTSPARGRAAA